MFLRFGLTSQRKPSQGRLAKGGEISHRERLSITISPDDPIKLRLESHRHAVN